MPLAEKLFQCRISLWNSTKVQASRSSFEMLLFHLRMNWWAWEDSNLRPYAYQAYALTTWATSPCVKRRRNVLFLRPWWRWGGSNSWPPACKAGALPAELHPRIRTGYRNFYHFSFPLLKVHNLSIAPSKLNNVMLLLAWAWKLT